MSGLNLAWPRINWAAYVFVTPSFEARASYVRPALALASRRRLVRSAWSVAFMLAYPREVTVPIFPAYENSFWWKNEQARFAHKKERHIIMTDASRRGRVESGIRRLSLLSPIVWANSSEREATECITLYHAKMLCRTTIPGEVSRIFFFDVV